MAKEIWGIKEWNAEHKQCHRLVVAVAHSLTVVAAGAVVVVVVVDGVNQLAQLLNYSPHNWIATAAS